MRLLVAGIVIVAATVGGCSSSDASGSTSPSPSGYTAELQAKSGAACQQAYTTGGIPAAKAKVLCDCIWRGIVATIPAGTESSHPELQVKMNAVIKKCAANPKVF